MKVVFLSIVLDGLPWIASHYPMFRTLPFEWEWRVVEGVALPKKCTSWCRELKPRLSLDGTTEYLNSLEFDPRVKVYRKLAWDGKVEMVNEPLKSLKETCLLWQIDSDEIWTAPQIARMRQMFLSHDKYTSAQFYCRYFVGPNLVTVERGLYGNQDYDWIRCWRFRNGMHFTSHEPPKMAGDNGLRFSQQTTADAGLVFDHFAYATESTVAFKQQYYGRNGTYEHALVGWRKLQATEDFPVKLRRYFSWVKDNVSVRKVNQ